MSDTTSLPTQDCDQSDSGILSTYVIRITPCEKFSFQQVVEYIKDEPAFFKYVISKETVPREHFHLVIQTDVEVDETDVREHIRSFIIPFWSQDGKLPRGFGNKQYNLQVSDDVDRAISYAVKLGEYVFEGYTPEYIKERYDSSFDKKKPCNFKIEY